MKQEKEDQIFMFSDGVYDQKGGEKGKKLYFKRFEEILIQMGSIPVSGQESFLTDKMEKWQGEMEQLDDMLVFGWKIK
jgi:serine phosphatase RsbU (regulator of sigma subunit)